MKKCFKYAMMLVAVVMSAVVISSCSKDDDTSGGSALVGTWSDNYDDEWLFRSDNTGYVVENGKQKDFSYKYEEPNLTLIWSSKTTVLKVTWYGSDKFSIGEEDHAGYAVLTRKK